MVDLEQLNMLSEELLLAVKMLEDTTKIRLVLSGFTPKDLENSLSNDEKKKAFWINIYNAYFQILRKEEQIERLEIYEKKMIDIGGLMFSLDDVEHGILRRNKYKKSSFDSSDIVRKNHIENLQVKQLDYRIHFALNCGAKSCPPIAFYKTENINEQLDIATQSFLDGESDIDAEKKEIYTSALFKWFSEDFGREEGIIRIFQEQLGKDLSAYKIKYKPYSWDEELDNFIEMNGHV